MSAADVCEPAAAAPPLASLADDAILTKILAGDVPVHSLEAALGDCERAVRLRRSWLESTTGVAPTTLPYQHFDYESVLGACAEMVVGFVPLPVGVAGPLLLNGREFQVPMATVEGCLIASTKRGCKAIAESGGATATLLQQGMTRAPVLLFPSAARAAAFKKWIEAPEHFATAKSAFDATSRFARLSSARVTVAGRYAYARFACTTGDAMGMNMVSKGVTAVLDALQASEFGDMQLLGLSGNLCSDKKPAAVNWIEGRGCSVVAEATLPADVVSRVLKTTPEAAAQLNTAKNLVGSAMAGTSGGFNAHASNIVTAVFLATGQDAAQNVESSNCITLMEAVPPDADGNGAALRISVTMPSIEVGTVGGGTHLKPQKACLELLGVAGAAADAPGANAATLAMVVAGAVLAGELSLIAALSAGHLMRAHMQLNRKAPPKANGV